MKQMPLEGLPDIQCVAVGGVADGLLFDVHADAQFVELSRPMYLKPLTSSTQQQPEVAEETGIYEVHLIGLTQHEELPPKLFAIAAVEGITIDEAFGTVMAGYIENTVNKQLAENKNDSSTH